jgi:hypothetical protein
MPNSLNDWKVATCEVMKTAMLNVLKTTNGDEAATLMKNVSIAIDRLRKRMMRLGVVFSRNELNITELIRLESMENLERIRESIKEIVLGSST